MDGRHLIRVLRITWSIAFGILCALLVALCVRSYWRIDIVGHQTTPHFTHFLTDGGGIILAYGVSKHDEAPPGKLDGWHFQYSKSRNINRTFDWGVIESANMRIIHCPIWVLTILTAALCYSSWLPWKFSVRTLLIAHHVDRGPAGNCGLFALVVG
jgi:hypothetical protein